MFVCYSIQTAGLAYREIPVFHYHLLLSIKTRFDGEHSPVDPPCDCTCFLLYSILAKLWTSVNMKTSLLEKLYYKYSDIAKYMWPWYLSVRLFIPTLISSLTLQIMSIPLQKILLALLLLMIIPQNSGNVIDSHMSFF